jgi:hypothetical protein
MLKIHGNQVTAFAGRGGGKLVGSFIEVLPAYQYRSRFSLPEAGGAFHNETKMGQKWDKNETKMGQNKGARKILGERFEWGTRSSKLPPWL